MAKAKNISGKSLEGMMVQWGLLSAEAAAAAAEHSRNEGINVARALSEKGFMNEVSVAEAICSHLSLAFINAQAYHVPVETSRLLPAEFQRQYEIVVVDRFDNTIVLATCGVPEDEILSEIKGRTGCDCQVFVTTASALRKRLSQLGSTTEPVQGASMGEEEEKGTVKAEAKHEAHFDPNVIQAKGKAPKADVRVEESQAEDQITQEADELFAELERDLERFAPLDESPREKADG